MAMIASDKNLSTYGSGDFARVSARITTCHGLGGSMPLGGSPGKIVKAHRPTRPIALSSPSTDRWRRFSGSAQADPFSIPR